MGGIIFSMTRGSFGGGGGGGFQYIARSTEVPLAVSNQNMLEYVDRATHGSPNKLMIHNNLLMTSMCSQALP